MNNQPHANTAPNVPDGYLQNTHGHLVPVAKIKEIDLVRHELVLRMTAIACDLQKQMQKDKDMLFDEFHDFLALSANEFGVELGGKKGNVSLLSYDGKYKIQLAQADNIVFDERLQVAKSLIDECLHEWTADSNDNIKALIDNAFNVDKEGNISTGRVLGLRRLNITDDKWLKAMQAITDAVQVVSSKSYIRFYERDENGKYQQISLDFAGL